MSGFGSVLRRLRRRSGLSQEALAARAGLSQDAISLLERGRREPRMTTLRVLAEAMNLSPTDRTELFSAPDAVNRQRLPLPRFDDSLVGREGELAELVARLRAPEPGLITVTGPGGVGKTRLAVTAATRIAADGASESAGRDGQAPATEVRWLPLSSLRSTAAFLPAVGVALGLRDADQHGLGAIVGRLSRSRQLLVLDNAEHLIEECRALCRAVLVTTRSVGLLVTSRQRLGLPGETVLDLSPLSPPSADATAPEVMVAPASRLFLDRAMAAASGRLSPAEATAVVRITRRLDGLPLALELAAARAAVMTLPELADRLDQTLEILPGPTDSVHRIGGSDLSEAVVGWSYRLLTPEQQTVFSRVAVFSGFTHDAMTAVCGDPQQTERDLVEIVAELVSQSLVTRTHDAGGRARFRLLSLVRTYAQSLFDDDPVADEARRRHAEFYTDVVQRAEERMAGGDDPAPWLSVLDTEVANIRSAVGWACAHDPELALRLTRSVWRWCYLRGRYTEGRGWCDAALRAGVDAPAPVRGPVLAGAGMLAFLQCDYAVATSLITEGLTLAEQTGDAQHAGWCLARLGSLAREQGHYEQASALHTRALQIATELGHDHEQGSQHNFLAFAAWLSGDVDAADEHSVIAFDVLTRTGDREGIVWALINRGAVALYGGDLDTAQLVFQQGLTESDELGFREGSAWALNQLGVVARLSGEPERAMAMQQASLAEHHDLGDRWREASVLDELAALAVGQGDFGTAAGRLGAADRLRSSIGAPVPAVERADRADTEVRCRAALGSTYRAAVLTGALRTP